MSNDSNVNREGERGGESLPGSPAEMPLLPGVLEDIGHGFVMLRPPATFDDIPFPAEEPDRVADYDWAQNDPEVQARHGGRVVAVRNKQIWGVGRTDRQAYEDAVRKTDCPRDLVFVFVWPALPPEDNGRRTV